MEDLKIPVYKSRSKKIRVKLLKWYGKLRNRIYIDHKIVEPDEWQVTSDRLVILDNGIHEEKLCWVVSYNSEIFNKTQDSWDCRLGIGPLLIDKSNGNPYIIGTGDDDNYIEEFNRFKETGYSNFNWEERKISL